MMMIMIIITIKVKVTLEQATKDQGLEEQLSPLFKPRR